MSTLHKTTKAPTVDHPDMRVYDLPCCLYGGRVYVTETVHTPHSSSTRLPYWQPGRTESWVTYDRGHSPSGVFPRHGLRDHGSGWVTSATRLVVTASRRGVYA